MGSVSARSLAESSSNIAVKLSNQSFPACSYLGRNAQYVGYDVAVIQGVYDYKSYLSISYVVYDFKNNTFAQGTAGLNTDATFETLEGEELDRFMEKVSPIDLKNISARLGHNFSIGSDPEIFVEDRDGNVINAWEFLGSKENPDYTLSGNNDRKYEQYNGCGNKPMYWDGPQAEFTTVPSTCMQTHTTSIASGLESVWLAANKKFPGAKLSLRSVVDIPFDVLLNAKEEHIQFGCMPSINAYGIRVNMPPAREVPFRSAGGHIHFGIGKVSGDEANRIVKGLDAILGVACVSMFANFDSPKRRVLYGLPGEYRLPPHGLEYRPLSNAWLAHPLITNLVFDFARKVVVMGQRGLLKYWQSTEAETVDTIINCDVNKAREILGRNKDLMISIIKAAYLGRGITDKAADVLFGIFANGMESVLATPDDFEKNWGFNGVFRYGANNNVRGCLPALLEGKKV